jgi:hypothetical protein
MAEPTTQESFFTLIERDPATSQIVKEVSCKSYVTTDENGEVVDSGTIVLDTKTFEVILPVVEVSDGNIADEPVVQPGE